MDQTSLSAFLSVCVGATVCVCTMYMSLHRHDEGRFYPFTGGPDECWEGDGLGYNVNIAWSGTSVCMCVCVCT